MPARVEQTEDTGAPGLHCICCGAVVVGTRHTRTGWVVGHYLLHTGRTEEATLRRGDDDVGMRYRRLLEPVEIISCARCFGRPEVRRLWAAFGDEERPPA